MVRLKAETGWALRAALLYFNSTMVRLKAYQIIETPDGIKFQFHYGTIKSARGLESIYKCIQFQFHYGTIKRVSSVAYPYARRISIPLWYD